MGHIFAAAKAAYFFAFIWHGQWYVNGPFFSPEACESRRWEVSIEAGIPINRIDKCRRETR